MVVEIMNSGFGSVSIFFFGGGEVLFSRMENDCIEQKRKRRLVFVSASAVSTESEH